MKFLIEENCPELKYVGEAHTIHEAAELFAKEKPQLIFLDLNMPGMGGKEFLKWIKSNEKYKNIPVVVLTTSDSEADIIECYKLHAAGYIQKPASVQELKTIMKQTIKYWSTSYSPVKC